MVLTNTMDSPETIRSEQKPETYFSFQLFNETVIFITSVESYLCGHRYDANSKRS